MIIIDDSRFPSRRQALKLARMSRDAVLHPFRPQVDLQIDYARELNPQQFAAVTAPPGPSLVIAGAGAGKTRTLIYRVAYLLEQGIPAHRILLLTFTNKAAREMMRRVAELLGGDLTELWGGTFHSIGHRFLRRHAELVGYRKDFTILDREDACSLVKACLAEAAIDTKGKRFPKADVVCDIFSLAVNTEKPIGAIVTEQYNYFQSVAAQLVDLEKRYLARKRATQVMDFDDLLVLWLQLLQDQPELREQYQRRFQFILVDEYQDTNKIQADLIDLLAARHENVMVVGDDSQSIYSWRGANFQNILEFPKRHPKTVIYRIETNYRSTPEILTVANAAIKANVHQFTKELAPVRPSGVKPVLVACTDASEQAVFVAQQLLGLREEGAALNKVAVLYRSHFHALELQLELTRRNILFTITSGIRFFEQTHLKDVTAHLKLVCNPRDEPAFKRVVQLLPGIGGKGADKLWGRYVAQLPQARSRTPLAETLQSCAPAVPKKAGPAWTQLAITFSQLEVKELRQRPDEMIRIVLEAGYEDYLRETFTNYESRRDDLAALATFARQFSNIEECLTQLALLSNLEAEEDRPPSQDDERVRLSTIHQAKGLEFDVVFVIMLCEGLFPPARATKSLPEPEAERRLEEERRLFYVAITRARNALYLSYPLIRGISGGTEDALQQPSRFLSEIPEELLEEWDVGSFARYQSWRK
jgi:DNA helicase-2/ATP-dependent DNA helicase PcrA